MKKLLVALMLACAAFTVQAELNGYFMLSFFSPGQLPVPGSSINGGRVSLVYGECQRFNGFDLGLWGHVRERANGFQAACVNSVGTDACGFQLGLVNWVENDLSGLQIGLVNYANTLSGCQLGLVNIVGSRSSCWPILNLGW